MDEAGDGDVHWRHAVVGHRMVEMRKSRRNSDIFRIRIGGGAKRVDGNGEFNSI